MNADKRRSPRAILLTNALLLGGALSCEAHDAGRVEFVLSEDGSAWQGDTSVMPQHYRVRPDVGLRVVTPAMSRHVAATRDELEKSELLAGERTTGIGVPFSVERAMLLDGSRSTATIR